MVAISSPGFPLMCTTCVHWCGFLAFQVYVEFSDADDCSRAHSALTGRDYNGQTVITSFYPIDYYYTDYFWRYVLRGIKTLSTVISSMDALSYTVCRDFAWLM